MNIRMSVLLAIMLLSWWGFNYRATGTKTEGESFRSPSLLDARGFLLSEGHSNSTLQCDGEDCYRGDGISHIISPRRTWLLHDEPTLRWYAVKGAESYTVKVEGVGVNWETVVSKTSTAYGGESLQPGQTYSFTVKPNNGEPASTEIFVMLPEEKAAIVKAEIAQLQQLTGKEPSWDLAQLYLKHELISEAIETLKALMDKNTQKVEVYCQLSKLYEEIELRDFARDSQTTASQLGGCD